MTTRQSYADPASPGGVARGLGTPDPGAFGLPSERELASLAAGYFPEFDAEREAEPAAYHPVVVPLDTPYIPKERAAFARDTNGRAFVGNVPLENILADFPILS